MQYTYKGTTLEWGRWGVLIQSTGQPTMVIVVQGVLWRSTLYMSWCALGGRRHIIWGTGTMQYDRVSYNYHKIIHVYFLIFYCMGQLSAGLRTLRLIIALGILEIGVSIYTCPQTNYCTWNIRNRCEYIQWHYYNWYIYTSYL